MTSTAHISFPQTILFFNLFLKVGCDDYVTFMVRGAEGLP